MAVGNAPSSHWNPRGVRQVDLIPNIGKGIFLRYPQKGKGKNKMRLIGQVTSLALLFAVA